MMHVLHKECKHPGQSSIVYLPMIDKFSGDKTCIVSTLDFVCNLATKHNMPPVITFDQPLFWKAAEIIMDAPQSSQLKCIVLLLGCFHTFMNLLGKSTDSLASLRYNIFSKKIASSKSFVRPERFPPTESSTSFHSQRVYYQLMIWMGNVNDKCATDWGWKLENNEFVPIMTMKAAAPDRLLQMIRCNCATACKSPRCSCRGYGLPCTPACGSCQAENCENPNNQPLQDKDCDGDL